MEKKYKLTDETITFGTITLHRIEAIRDFGDVKAGDKGGWIEHEGNLSQDDTCWVGGNAMVYQDALVCCDARIYGDAEVHGNALVCDNAQVCDNAKVCGDACVCGDAIIYGAARA